MDAYRFPGPGRLLRLLAIAALALAALTVSAREAASPEAAVRAFYAWYFAKDAKGGFPLLDDGIRAHVAEQTVNGLRDAYRREDLPGDADYFLKVQDYQRDWPTHVDVRQATLLGDVAVVPVRFGETQPGSVVVFLRWEGGRWKIVKVDDTRGYP